MSPKCLHRIFWAIEKDEKAFSGVSTERNYHGRTQIAKLKSLMRITGLRRVFQKTLLFGWFIEAYLHDVHP
jgi:hypothetical protein